MKLFTKVKCHAYLKRVYDGVFIGFEDKYGTPIETKTVPHADIKAFAWRLNPETLMNEKFADLSEWCGQSVEKKYRERIEEEFTGFLVGITRIKISGRIGTDWESDSYYGEEFGHCFKVVDDYPKVGVVYFKNNAKRYVLLEDMEEEKQLC